MMKQLIFITLMMSGISAGYAQDEKVESLGTGNVDIAVYRSPTCACCGKWLAHLDAQGFHVTDHVVANMQEIKDQYGIAPSLSSCHTAIINGYVVEGHVPAGDIKAMLKNKENIKGLSVPGMIVGTPGMEMGEQKSPYKVIAFDTNGKLKVYKNYQ